MTARNHQTLEQRVAQLEAEIKQLRSELPATVGPRHKDWRRTIGAFTDNLGMQVLFEEALKLREADRRKARRKPAKRAKPRTKS